MKRRWRVQFADPVEVFSAWHVNDVVSVLKQVQAHSRAGHWCVGEVVYEAASAFDAALTTHRAQPGWPLARFAAFDKALPWPEAGKSVGNNEMDDFGCADWSFSMSRGDYEERFERARKAIAAGECYQINLTGALWSHFSGNLAQWVGHLQKAQPEAYVSWLDWGDQQVLSLSPELFFDWRPDATGGQLICKPMKGTAPRHADQVCDQLAYRHLLDSEKERAENIMIVDLLRSDMGRIAQLGTVRVRDMFTVQALPTVWQMTSTVTADTLPNTGLAEVFGALFPCGSVTGAPKARAMQWIRELESEPRGIYCGAVGVVRPCGAATFNVPIRTLMLEREKQACKPAHESWIARYGVGSGVTFYAEAEAEWRELAAKSRLLWRSSRRFDLLETLRLENGQYWLLEEHLARLAGSAAYFGFPWNSIEAEMLLRALANEHAAGIFRTRLTLSEYGQVRVHASPLPPTAEPVLFALSSLPLETGAGYYEFLMHKTTRREHYETRLRTGVDLFDTLLINERGELTEFTRGNVALKIGGRWLTPALRCGLLAGTYRTHLLASGDVTEAVLKTDDLQRAEEIAFFNSVRGWLRAQYQSTSVGSVSDAITES